jgi:hypothetical protein
VALQQRLRDLVGSVSNKLTTSNASASSPPAAAPRAADVRSHPAGAVVTDGTGSHGDPHMAPTGGLDDLAIAHGHELVGPCRDCAGYWTRELARGQKPLTCPVCKRLGPPA